MQIGHQIVVLCRTSLRVSSSLSLSLSHEANTNRGRENS